MAHAGGRPTDYRPEYVEQAYKLCSLGAIDDDLADFFHVSRSTISLWKKEHKEFSDAIKESKANLDAKVEKRLFEKAMGYDYTEEAATKVGIVELKKTAHPDTTAMIFWLKNRKPADWRDKHELQVSHIDIGKPPTPEEAEFPE